MGESVSEVLFFLKLKVLTVSLLGDLRPLLRLMRRGNIDFGQGLPRAQNRMSTFSVVHKGGCPRPRLPRQRMAYMVGKA